MAQRLRYVFGDGSHTYTSCKQLCDVFGDPSKTSRRIRMTNVVSTLKLEEDVGDNITDEQQSQVGEAPDACAESSCTSAIRDNVVKYHCPDLNFLPPKKDDEYGEGYNY
ncbi:hypothetical protein KY284_026695 [Solanum tuberosum]|nr:hypothetical protein KY284_026695 [Solanum tuberosum]